MGLGANPFRFFRCRSERDRKFIEDAVEWQKDKKVSRKLHVVEKVLKRDGKKRDIIIPEDIELPKTLLPLQEKE